MAKPLAQTVTVSGHAVIHPQTIAGLGVLLAASIHTLPGAN